jgi:hypothetical protein
LADPEAAFHVSDWVDNQHMCDATYAKSNTAVEATRGQYLAYQGWPITAMYSAENSSPTRTNFNVGYLQAVDDPVSFGQARFGHGYGFSQWGGRRWAETYGWSYGPILLHYYTNVTLQAGANTSNAAPPVAVLARPWHGFYVNSNHLLLATSVADDGGAVLTGTIWLTADSVTTPIFQDTPFSSQVTYGPDISGWPERNLATRPLTLSLTASDSLGQVGQSQPVRFGLDRVPPTGVLTTPLDATGGPAFTGTAGLPVFLSASDATAGVTHIALGPAEWAWSGAAFTGDSGRVISDSLASDGWAWQARAGFDAPGAWFSPPLNLPVNRPYRAYFRLRLSEVIQLNEVLLLEVFETGEGASSEPLGLHRVRGVSARTADRYQEFHLDFWPKTPLGTTGFSLPLSFKLTYHGLLDVTFDRVVVVDYPQPFAGGLLVPPEIGLGQSQRYRLKLIDGANNVSPDLWLTYQAFFSEYLPLMLK